MISPIPKPPDVRKDSRRVLVRRAVARMLLRPGDHRPPSSKPISPWAAWPLALWMLGMAAWYLFSMLASR